MQKATYSQTGCTSICCHAPSRETRQCVSPFDGISEDILTGRAIGIFDDIIYKRQNREICRVHDKPVRTTKQTSSLHLARDMYNVSRDTYARSGACETAFVNILGLTGLRDIMDKGSVYHHLNMGV